MRRTIVILGLVAATWLAASNDVFAQRRGLFGRRGGDYYYDRGGYYPADYGYDTGPGQTADSSMPMSAQDMRRSYYGDPNSCTVMVRVPTPDAQVWFDDTPTKQRGMERVFTTPALQQGGTYTIKARWTENGRAVDQERRVRVQPGQPAMVDFRSGGSTEKLNAPMPTR